MGLASVPDDAQSRRASTTRRERDAIHAGGDLTPSLLVFGTGGKSLIVHGGSQFQSETR